MSALAPWVLLHTGHPGGIPNTILAMGIAGIGVLLVVVGLYRLHTYEEPTHGFEDEPQA